MGLGILQSNVLGVPKLLPFNKTFLLSGNERAPVQILPRAKFSNSFCYSIFLLYFFQYSTLTPLSPHT